MVEIAIGNAIKATPAPFPNESKETPCLLTKNPRVENTVIPAIISNELFDSTVINELFTISCFSPR